MRCDPVWTLLWLRSGRNTHVATMANCVDVFRNDTCVIGRISFLGPRSSLWRCRFLSWEERQHIVQKSWCASHEAVILVTGQRCLHEKIWSHLTSFQRQVSAQRCAGRFFLMVSLPVDTAPKAPPTRCQSVSPKTADVTGYTDVTVHLSRFFFESDVKLANSMSTLLALGTTRGNRFSKAFLDQTFLLVCVKICCLDSSLPAECCDARPLSKCARQVCSVYKISAACCTGARKGTPCT